MHHSYPNIIANISKLFGCICANQLFISIIKRLLDFPDVHKEGVADAPIHSFYKV